MTLQPSREEIEGEMAEAVNLEQPTRIESTLEQSVDETSPPNSTLPLVVDVEQRLQSVARMEQEFAQRENFVIPVAKVENLRKPESTKDWNVTNQMVQPTHDGKLYVQTKHGFQERKIDEDPRPKKTLSEQLHPKLPEIRHQQGEGFLTGIRSLSRFCLGISAGVALVISLGTQMEVKFDDQVQEAIEVTVSVLVIVTCFGTLCNVDPVGHGGWSRLFRMDPAGLANLCVLIAVILSAVADCLYEQDRFEDQNNTPDAPDPTPNTGYLTVSWIRTALLVVAWGAMSFSDPPGGALYHRIKNQNAVSIK